MTAKGLAVEQHNRTPPAAAVLWLPPLCRYLCLRSLALLALLQLCSWSKSEWVSLLTHCNVFVSVKRGCSEAKQPPCSPSHLPRTWGSSSQKGCRYKGHLSSGQGPFSSTLLALLSPPSSALKSTGPGASLPTAFPLSGLSPVSARTAETALSQQKSAALFAGPLDFEDVSCNCFASIAHSSVKEIKAVFLRKTCFIDLSAVHMVSLQGLTAALQQSRAHKRAAGRAVLKVPPLPGEPRTNRFFPCMSACQRESGT